MQLVVYLVRQVPAHLSCSCVLHAAITACMHRCTCSACTRPVATGLQPQLHPCSHLCIPAMLSRSNLKTAIQLPGFVPHQREYSADSTEIKKQLVVRLAARQLMWCTQDGRRCARWYGSGLRRSKRAPGRALLPLQLWCGAGCLSLPSCGLKVWCLSCQVLRKSAHCTQGLASTTSTPNTGWTLAALTLALLDQL